MTTRIPVSAVQNKWFDAQRVDKSDLDVEQSNNDQMDSAIVQNFFSSGVLLEKATPLILFDTDPVAGLLTAAQAALIAAGNFDGTGISPYYQPSDTDLGNQLAIELSESLAYGRNCVKVAIIGLSFDNQLIMDRLYFHTNETQITSKHYKVILSIFFNDFLGNNNCSKYLGGRIKIRETKPFEISRDTISVAQDVQPDIFWRDFKVADYTLSLFTTIQNGIGSVYDANDLNITTTGRQPYRSIEPNDVITRVGQKFKATTDNIQKITLLLGVEKDETVATEDWFNWTGNLIVSIHALQNTVDSPSDIIPELLIDYEPNEIPLVEVSFSKEELEEAGYVLTDIVQPVDFIFNNTVIASSGKITVGNYYLITFRRSGTTTTGTIFAEVGTDRLDDSRLSVYSGIWVDSSEEDLWFQVWSDACKISDGQAYDLGKGIRYPKTITSSTTGAEIDNEKRYFSLKTTAEGTINTAILQASVENSVTVQDERTGNNVYSRMEYVPSFSFKTTSELTELQESSEPLVIGCVVDNNPKTQTLLTKVQNYPGLAKGNKFTIINPDSDLLSMKLIGRKLIPQQECSNYSYVISKVIYCTDGYGDVNGENSIDINSIARATELIGESLSYLSTQQKIADGIISTLEIKRADVNNDGYITSEDVDLITQYVNREINSFPAGTGFSHLDIYVQRSIGRYDSYWECDGYIRSNDGYQNIIDPATLTEAERLYYGNPGNPSIDGENAIFNVIPFSSVNYQIKYMPFWQDYLVSLSSNTRTLVTTFSYNESVESNSCSSNSTICSERGNEIPTCDPGRNDIYIPDNLIIGNGRILKTNGDEYNADLEIAVITLELPKEQIFNEAIIDVFRSFICDRGDGKTNANFSCLRYSDCSTIQPEDLILNRIRCSCSIQSFTPSLNGYDLVDGYGITINSGIGVYYSDDTGLLKITVSDLEENQIYRTLITKIQIIVYLKKSGWKNSILTISPDQISGLLVH
jgi:hypothetical protein